MNKADCFNLGYVAKLHGFKGEVSLFLDVTNPADYSQMDSLFIDVNGLLTPFFIERIKINNKGFALVKLEGVDNEIDAKVLLRKELYLPLEVLPPLTGINFYDHEVIGYAVLDEQYGQVGVLQQILDYKVNPLIQIDANGKEVLLPLIEGLITSLDRENKVMHVKSPAGLIALYLGE